MFGKRTTTTTTTAEPMSPQYGPQAAPIAPVGPVAQRVSLTPPLVQAVPVVRVADAAFDTAPTSTRPYEAVVPVPVTSVTAGGMSNVATADRTYQPDVRRSYALVRVTQFIWLLVGALEALFAVRVILNLIGANPTAGFAQFITNITTPFLAPFAGLMNNPTASNGNVLEITTLIAMLVYLLVAWGIVRLLWIVFERRVAR